MYEIYIVLFNINISFTLTIPGINSSSFNCKLELFDIMSGHTNPTNFKLIVFPLAQSFDEGFGRDVISFDDSDTTCIDGIQKAINKYPNHKIKFANGGDRKGITTLENKETNLIVEKDFSGELNEITYKIINDTFDIQDILSYSYSEYNIISFDVII